MFISITFRGTNIDETNKTQQKVRGSKFMYRQTDRQTDILPRHCPRYAYASRGKNTSDSPTPCNWKLLNGLITN